MSQLHLLVVIDSETGEFHIDDLDHGPVDSAQSVFDDPEWREPTEEERDKLMDAEARLHALIHPEVAE